MKSLTLLALFTVVGRVLSQSGYFGSGSGAQYVPVCDRQEYMQTPIPPIPSLPDQFSTIIEGNIVQSNYTALVAEYYDNPGNRGRFEYVIQETDIESGVAIYDYNLGEAFLIPDRERNVSCGVQLLTNFSDSIFGITYVNGSVHIGTVTQLFQVAPNESAKYLGVDSVRGIPCNHWQTCHVYVNNSYTLDYYFASTSDWKYAFSGESVPIQIELNGAKISDDGTLDTMHHVYSFIAFHSGPSAVPDSVFEVPTGLPCLGRIAGEDLPEVPPFFSLQFETLEDPYTIGTVREFYDALLFRLDVRYNNTLYSIIHDFDLSVEYIIDRHGSHCYVQPLTNASFLYDMARGTNGTFQLRSPTDFFRLGTGYNFSYEGVTSIRGIEADAWISIRDSFPLSVANNTLDNATVEVFYSRPGWTSRSLYSTSSDPIPLAINLTGIIVNRSCDDEMCENAMEFSAFYNIFDFSSQEPDFDVFDTSFCSTPGEYDILSLIIPGQEGGMDLSQLRRSVRLGLTGWAGIPALQVSNIQVLGENGTDIFVTLQILPLPSIAHYANPRTPQEILQNILNGTSANDQLPFTIELPSGGSVRPYLLRIDPSCPVPSPTTPTKETTTSTIMTSPTTPTKETTTSTIMTSSSTNPDTRASDCPTASSTGSSNLSSGAVAGIAITMFIVGMICALLLVLLLRFCQTRSKTITLNKYRKQENELEGFTD